MKKNAIPPGEVPADQRVRAFSEVVTGYSESDALAEAARCLQCKNPPCVNGCPVNIDIKKFIHEITLKNYAQAAHAIREKNNFAAICGRVCPAEYQCRRACVLTKKGEPFASPTAINIHFLERFAGDFGILNKVDLPEEKDGRLSRFRAAVVGSGPAGLSTAGELARAGVSVTVFEGLHKLGGVLQYGIPPFRLPRDILDHEIQALTKMGVQFVTNTLIGRTRTLDDLFADGYSAIFLGLGAGIPSFMGIPGENLGNIYTANEFLTRVNLMNAYKFPEVDTPVNIGKHIVVIGGGNTAMDAARSALRLQIMSGLKPDTTIVYRRSEEEMPARRLEIEHAKEEGVTFRFLTQPKAFTGSDDGLVSNLECLKCELGAPDASGRRSPIPVKNSDFLADCDLAVIAIGLRANELLTKATPSIQTDKYGDIVVDRTTMATSVKGVFAGGDIVGGEGTVIEAMGMGKKAAKAMIDFLRTLN